MPWFGLLLAVHIALAVSMLLPSLLLPFLLRRADPAGGSATGSRGAVVHALLVMQGSGSVVVAIGLAITGAGLLAILGPDLLRRPWLLVALAIYAANLLLAGLVSRPNLRRLLRRGADADPQTWRRRARRQRLIAYLMAGATGAIGFLMSTKPEIF